MKEVIKQNVSLITEVETESNNNSTKIHLVPNHRTYIYTYIHTVIISLVETQLMYNTKLVSSVLHND